MKLMLITKNLTGLRDVRRTFTLYSMISLTTSERSNNNKMGRKKIEIDPVKIYKLSAQGVTQLEMAKKLGVSHVTLARRMAEITGQQGILLKYRSIQNLQLTALQAKVLEAITPEKIEDSSLVDLCKAFKVLKSKETEMRSERIAFTGLVQYLFKIEEDERGD